VGSALPRGRRSARRAPAWSRVQTRCKRTCVSTSRSRTSPPETWSMAFSLQIDTSRYRPSLGGIASREPALLATPHSCGFRRISVRPRRCTSRPHARFSQPARIVPKRPWFSPSGPAVKNNVSIGPLFAVPLPKASAQRPSIRISLPVLLLLRAPTRSKVPVA
jgi:hypothetical protein